MKPPFFLLLRRSVFLASVLCATPGFVLAGRPDATHAATQAIAGQVEQYLIESLAQSYEGEPTVSVTPPASLQGLADCGQFQVYMPPGRKLLSMTTVGVRCQTGEGGTVYVRATVAVQGTYYVAAQTIGANQLITQAMLETRSGNLLSLPDHARTTPAQLVGRITTARIPAGKPVRLSATRSMLSVQRGDTVRVVAHAPGLSVTNRGEALATADVGGSVQVRLQNGKTIQGVVSDSGAVFVTF